MKPVAVLKSRPVAVRKSRPVAVKKMKQGFDSQGNPIMMFEGGAGGTPTYLSSALGAIGTIGGGVLGALGPHRSLSSLAQGVQSGAYTGRDLGRAAGKITRVIPGARRRLAARGARREADEAYRAERTKREGPMRSFLPAIGDYMPNLMTHEGRSNQLANWKDEEAINQLYGKERARAMFYGEGGDGPDLDELESLRQDALERHAARTGSRVGVVPSQRRPLEDERPSRVNTAMNVMGAMARGLGNLMPVRTSTNTGIDDQTDGVPMNADETDHDGELRQNNMYEAIDAMGESQPTREQEIRMRRKLGGGREEQVQTQGNFTDKELGLTG